MSEIKLTMSKDELNFDPEARQRVQDSLENIANQVRAYKEMKPALLSSIKHLPIEYIRLVPIHEFDYDNLIKLEEHSHHGQRDCAQHYGPKVTWGTLIDCVRYVKMVAEDPSMKLLVEDPFCYI